MATVDFDKRFAPAEATRGQFVPIDGSTLSGGLPSGSRGRYAVLTYNIGAESSTPGASATSPSYFRIVDGNSSIVTDVTNVPDPILGGTVNALNVRIAESIAVLSAFEVDATGVSGLQIRAEVTYPDTSEYVAVAAGATTVTPINFAQKVTVVEVFNTSQTDTVYVSFDTGTVQTLSAQALPLLPETFYSIDREAQNVYIANANSSSVDVRAVGHYRLA